MSDLPALAREIPFTGALDAVDTAVRETAGAFNMSLRPAGAEWVATAGDWLATNPNDVRWSLHAAFDGAVRLNARAPALPWARGRMARIVAHRLSQFAEHLAARLAGTPRPTAARELAPFSAGSTPADSCLAFAGHVAMAVCIMTGVMAAVTLASLLVVDGVIDDLHRRAEVMQRVGAPVLPPAHDLAGMGFGRRLAAAALLAMPVAFFLGLVHSLAHLACDLWRRASRLPLVAALFTGVMSAIAFAAVMPVPAGIGFGALVPALAYAGATLAWGRRRETILVAAPAPGSARPRVVAAILGVAVLALLLPAVRQGKEFTDQLALFRDRYLLTHSLGRAYTNLYYRVTLYSAEPVKEAYGGAAADDPYDKQAPLALLLVDQATATAHLRELGFVVERGDASRIGEGVHDLVVTDDDSKHPGGGRRTLVIPRTSDPAAWRSAIREASRRGFRASWLLELVRTGWVTIYYVGAFFGIALVMAPLAGLAGVLYRRMPAKRGHGVVAGAFVVTLVALGWLYAGAGPELTELAALRNADAGALGRALASKHASVRHEAAYRLYRQKDPPREVEALLLAVEDGDARVRLWACGALGRTRDARATGPLIGKTRDPEILVRYRAAEGLGLLEEGQGPAADAGVVRVLLAMIRERSWYEGTYALEALRRIDRSRW